MRRERKLLFAFPIRSLAVPRSTVRGDDGDVGDVGDDGDDGNVGDVGVDGDTPFTLLKSQFNFGLRILCTKSRPEPR